MHLIGQPYSDQNTFESHAYNLVEEILEVKHRLRDAQRRVYACLAAQGSRTARRGALCPPRARDLPGE